MMIVGWDECWVLPKRYKDSYGRVDDDVTDRSLSVTEQVRSARSYRSSRKRDTYLQPASESGRNVASL